MRGIGSKLALHGKALLQAVERMVDGCHERRDFRRQIFLREPDRRGIGTDRRRHPGNLAHGFEAVADREDPDSQCCQHQQRTDPNRVE